MTMTAEEVKKYFKNVSVDDFSREFKKSVDDVKAKEYEHEYQQDEVIYKKTIKCCNNILKSQREDLLEVLCDNYFDYLNYEEYRPKLLITVIRYNYKRVLQILIKQGIPLNPFDDIKWHSLYIAIECNNYDALVIILNSGINPDGLYNHKTREGKFKVTPLMYAARDCKDPRIIRELLNRRANGALKDNQNRTAFDYLNLQGRDGRANVELRDNPEIFDLLKHAQDPKAKKKTKNDQTSIF